MLGDKSHRLSAKGGDQSSGLRISFSSLFAREMLGVRIPPLERKRWLSNRPASHFFFLAIRSGNAWRSNPTFIIKKRALRAHFLLWRKRWDSNPRAVARKRFSRAPRYDHFGTFPFLFLFYFSQFPKEFLYDFKAFFFHNACCNGDVSVGDG